MLLLRGMPQLPVLYTLQQVAGAAGNAVIAGTVQQVAGAVLYTTVLRYKNVKNTLFIPPVPACKQKNCFTFFLRVIYCTLNKKGDVGCN